MLGETFQNSTIIATVYRGGRFSNCYALKLLCGGGGSLLLQQTSILWYDFAGGDIESHYLEIISHDLHT